MDQSEVYRELGRNYRFFATWRHLTFAAGAGVWAGVLTLAPDKGLISDPFQISCIAAAFAEIILLMIDARTRSLISAAVKQGAQLEDSPGGFFKGVDVPPNWPSHTESGRLFYVGSSVAFLFLALQGWTSILVSTLATLGALAVGWALGRYGPGRLRRYREHRAVSEARRISQCYQQEDHSPEASAARLALVLQRWGELVDRVPETGDLTPLGLDPGNPRINALYTRALRLCICSDPPPDFKAHAARLLESLEAATLDRQEGPPP